jgi:dTDP-4-dehydrorhamnose 3,5-epimerase
MSGTIEFKIKETPIPGLLEITMDSHGDSRGWFTEKFQKEKLVALGFPKDFTPIQHSLSFNEHVGVTRGLHAEPWDKYISVIKGKAFAVYVDLHPGESFGKKFEITLDSSKAIFLPKGVANSFQTLEPETYYSYLTNGHWSPDQKYEAINLADPALDISWPIPLDKALISDKDKNHPLLKDLR